MKGDAILILGTGALATLFANYLAKAGMSVSILGTWQEGLSALKKNGARVEGEKHGYQVHASDDPQKCKGIPNAIVLVKSWQTTRAAEQLAGCLPGEGVALTLQNGLGNDSILASHLGRDRVARGVTSMGATLLGPGLVSEGGVGPVTVEANEHTEPLVQGLRRADFDVETVKDIKSQVWGKLVVSSAINPLTALLRIKNGVLLELPPIRILMRELASETAAVAVSEGVKLPFADPGDAAEEVAQRTAGNLSSMLQDVMRGAETEIEAINGEVVRLAAANNVSVPVNRAMVSLVNAIRVRGKIDLQ
jgi:2-dehydropantoate 2-reductase